MTEYAVLIPADEAAWARASAEEKSRMYAVHQEFAELLAARGHKVTGGAELTPAATGNVVSGSLDDVTVTAGPYAESVEQISGFYTVETDDLDDLLKVVGKLAEGERRLEVRECVDHS
jgi:hypothetical protein